MDKIIQDQKQHSSETFLNWIFFIFQFIIFCLYLFFGRARPHNRKRKLPGLLRRPERPTRPRSADQTRLPDIWVHFGSITFLLKNAKNANFFIGKIEFILLAWGIYKFKKEWRNNILYSICTVNISENYKNKSIHSHDM